MSDIEWQETHELQPAADLIADFCTRNGIAPVQIPTGPEPLVFIEQRALEALYDFLAHDLEQEQGGVLVGQPFYDTEVGRHFVVILAAIPAHETQSSSVHLQFTPQTWEYISGLIEENYPDQVIVGWYHSHPGLGVFMSATDRATQTAFFNHPWSLAVVVDPLVYLTGWFAGADCLPLSRLCVFPYESPSEATSPKAVQEPSDLEEEYWLQHSLDRLKWLLPFSMLVFSLLIFVWWYGKSRFT